jgi:hypothetical protein
MATGIQNWPSASAYRIVGSTNPPAAIRAKLAALGIADHCNALAGRCRTRHVQVFVMADGRIIPEDSRVLAEVAR